MTTTIRAKIHPRLLKKADRLFTGSVDGRVIELLQNARRAGATKVEISNRDGWVTVKDNGAGIQDFSKLLDLGDSGWDEKCEKSEDPAGVGLFCLAPRKTIICSNGSTVELNEKSWMGSKVLVKDCSEKVKGTAVQFNDQKWGKETVEKHAVFSGMKVSVDGEDCDQKKFVTGKSTIYKKLGCKIEVVDLLGYWYDVFRSHFKNNALVNFHGQVVEFSHNPISHHNLCYLIDFTGESTDIRLMLPARTRLVENQALEELKKAIEIEAYKYLQRQGQHKLPYKEYLRAKDLGIDLPESEPCFSVGVLEGDSPEPISVKKPEDLPLNKCYRLSKDLKDEDVANAHLLAALGKTKDAFVPVTISPVYDGYSWANLPLVTDVKVTSGKTVMERSVWSETLTCVEQLTITAKTGDGKVFSAPVCMAVPANNDNYNCFDLNVTANAETHLFSSYLWYHLGGFCENGDSYDTQEYQFEEELDTFWNDLLGPDENLRKKLFDKALGFNEFWKTVTIHSDGTIKILSADDTERVITPRSNS